MDQNKDELYNKLIDISKIDTEDQFYNILIMANSPEERSVKSLERVLDKIKLDTCIFIVFTDLLEYKKQGIDNWLTYDERNIDALTKKKWKDNLVKIENLLRQKNINFLKIEGKFFESNNIIKKIKSSVKSDDKIIFDITSFPKNFILSILRWIEASEITCVYTVAEHEKNSESYSIGVKKIAALRGFEGDIRARNDLLILLLGYEGYRSLAVLNRHEPYKALALVGDPKNDERQEYIEIAKKNNSFLLDHNMVIESSVSSIEHPFIIFQEIENSINNFINNLEKKESEGYNIFISPLGTKIQTIALYIYWLKHPDVQIVYPFPTKRRIGTGKAVNTYIFKIKLEKKESQ